MTALTLGEKDSMRADIVFGTSSYSSVTSKSTIGTTTQILASLVPDEIIYTEPEKTTQLFNGVLLFVDVSGFTDLCEKYSRLGKGGPSRITQVLNAYIGAMVQEIMSHNGDILKFSGDAFLALWKCSDEVSMSDVVHAAIDCALGIQKSHGTYKTEVGIVLRVKMALAAGPVIFTVIEDSNFMILGNTMLAIKELGNMCGPGDIIISANINMFLGANEYITESIEPTRNMRVRSIGPEWTPSTLGNQYELFDSFAETEHRKVDVDDESEISVVVVDDDDKPAYLSYMLRPSIDYAVTKNLNFYLRKFIIPSVMRAIDLHEPLDYLTEMRQVVIMFVNIVTQNQKIKSIIDICNTSYNIIYDMVCNVGGCLNKISLFDKDLMMLVIFGLRGFKHALEARRALYCAKKMREKLWTVEGIESASIGVCTGITYCGVVGHPMRKEYTVIGRTVNKAARLMCAYPDMVSCDRQTFLQSQLQARYFILQPARYLKGFQNVGPIYQFDDTSSEEEVVTKELSKTLQYPLLDRRNEMELIFYLLLNDKEYYSDLSLLCTMVTTFNLERDYQMIVVKGRDRQGKTRLLNEIGYYVGNKIQIHKCTFNSDSKKYKLFKCMFKNAYNFNNEEDPVTRTNHVSELFKTFKVPEFLCALNEILDIKFEVSKYYERLNEEQKNFVLHKMIKYLCVKAFKEKCIIMIDNIEYMDEESWDLLNDVLNTKLVFICATMGNYGNLSEESSTILMRLDVIITELQPIDKLYHAGLICQFLNVVGVPLELERYVQLHSYGNPGWIESFLTTLSDSNGFKIINISKTKAIEEGYVLPAHDMVLRHPNQTITSSSILLIEPKEGSFITRFADDIEGWDIYNQTIKHEDKKIYDNIPDEISVCVLSSNFYLEDLDTEDFLDVSMLQTYDFLKVHEQQLLKCSAILGTCFSRTMLEYVMQNKNSFMNALAIKKLFEIHVFSCGRAKCVNGAIQVFHYLTDPNEDKDVKCYCSGFPVNPNLANLPKYANCGYIRFREPAFREMLCNLLTETQANLYHVRAMWFLESQTKKCLACGLGYFVTLMGQSNDDGLKTRSVEQMPSLVRYRSADNDNESVPGISYEDRLESHYKSIRSLQTIAVKLSKMEASTNIETVCDKNIRTFADNSLINCECDLVLITMYTQMIKHCQEAGLNGKLMHALLEYAALCIKIKNITVAFTLLEKASNLLETKLKYEYLEPNWQIPLAKGRIMLLTGQLHIERASYDEAKDCLLRALQCYNLKFPRSKLNVKLKAKAKEIKQKIIVQFCPNRFIGSKDEDVCTLSDKTAEVLNSLFILYTRTFQYDKAYLASVWSMNEALKSDSNFAVMCTSYCNIMKMDMVNSRKSIMTKLEEMSLNMCFRKHTRLEKDELIAVIKLYGSIFCRLCLCENIRDSLRLGYTVIQLNSPEFGAGYKWPMLPLMLKALIFTYSITEAALLVEQSYYYVHMSSGDDPMIYYILCIEFKMYTTYSIIPFVDCLTQIKHTFETDSTSVLSIIESRYYIAIWLWYLRKGNWQSATNLIMHIYKVIKWPFKQEPSMVYSMMHILEGFLIISVRYLNTCDIENFKETKKLLKELFSNMKSITTKLICVYSRYLLLKAVWLMINNKQKKAFKLLDKASVSAKKCNIYYEVEWIEHIRNHWLHPTPQRHSFDEWQVATDVEDTKAQINWKDLDSKQIKIPFYTFPLPL